MDLQAYWNATLRQDAAAMRMYFHPDAYINWHNTNEHFTVEEYIRANCEYPGSWNGEIERVETVGSLIITATHVWETGGLSSFHVTSFIQIENGKILSVDEYWGDDGKAPQWRLDKHIGVPIR